MRCPIEISLEPLADLDRLADEWRALQVRADVSFFTSWGWIGCWLRQLPDHVQPLVLRVRDAGSTIGLAVFCVRVQRRHQLFVSRGLHLNQAGDAELDSIMIEHNGLVIDREHSASVGRAVIDWIASERPEWDEICLSGVSSLNNAGWPSEHPALRHEVIDQKHGAYVDLREVRESGKPYLNHLSGNTRQQIRRSLRHYEATSNPCELNVAGNLAEALEYYAALRELHQAYWQSKGERGAFANPFLDAFHTALIRERFGDGEIQLLQLRGGGRTIGYLYNFVFNGRVMNYQSGFRYENDPHCRPGLVSHALAVEHNLAADHHTYDFLAGDERYKQSLSTHSSSFTWHLLQRPRLRFRVEQALRAAKRGLQSRLLK